jgi:hypothetical protein
MESFDYYRNKHLLGELTLSDLMEYCEIEGEFSIGKNWLPIVRRRVSKMYIEFFMDSVERDPDLVLPLDSRVLLEGNIVRIGVDWVFEPQGREVWLRLDRVPDWL